VLEILLYCWGGAGEISHHRESVPGGDFTLMKSLYYCPCLCRAYLVPSYSFGENETYNQETFAEGTWLRFFQKNIQKIGKRILGINLCTIHGRGLTRGSWGFLPFNHPITTVGELSTFSRPLKFLISYPKSSIPRQSGS
jgi:hypothetical protein